VSGHGFADVAARLAGVAGLLLGWRPGTFWAVTPMELAVILNAAAGDGGEGVPLDGGTLARLKEMYPDG
jgi:uncharacterized phage protein (TIGR02216 family)